MSLISYMDVPGHSLSSPLIPNQGQFDLAERWILRLEVLPPPFPRALPRGVCHAMGPHGRNSVGVFTCWKARQTLFLQPQSFIWQRNRCLSTRQGRHSLVSTRGWVHKQRTCCRYADAPCSFLQASFIIQHVFTTEQQIVSGITRQEHVFGYGVLPAKPGTCSAELQFPALTGSKQQPRQQWSFWWCWEQVDEEVLHFSRNGDDDSPYFRVLLQGKYCLSSKKKDIFQNRELGEVFGKMMSRF